MPELSLFDLPHPCFGTVEDDYSRRPMNNYKSFNQALGIRLRGLREERGWSMGTMVATHRIAHYTALEEGSRMASVRELLCLADAFGVTLAGLVEGLGPNISAERKS